MKRHLIFFIFLLLCINSCAPKLNGKLVSNMYEKGITTSEGKNIPIPGYTKEDAAIFYLVRHAEKEKGKDPGLTTEGTIRAKKLGKMLEHVELDAIYSTNRKRTTDTARPTAELQKKTIDNYDAKKQEDFIKDLLPMKGKRALIVGHSNTIPNLLNLFQSNKVYDHIDESEYDNFYVLMVYGKDNCKIIELKY